MLDTLRETINNSEPSAIPNITNNLVNNVEVVQPSLEMSMGSSDSGGGEFINVPLFLYPCAFSRDILYHIVCLYLFKLPNIF